MADKTKRQQNFIKKMFDGEQPDTSMRGRFVRAFGMLMGKDIILKDRRSVDPSYVMDEEAKVRGHPYDFEELWEAFNNSWVLQAISDAIKQEVLRNGLTVEPKFKAKCKTCGKEFSEEVDECDICKSKEFTEPDVGQRKEIERLTGSNMDYNFEEVLTSVLDWELGLGNWFITVGKRVARNVERAWDLVVEDARYIYPIADVFNNLGGYEYFCPVCWDRWVQKNHLTVGFNFNIPNTNFVKDIRGLDVKKDPKCPYCGEVMIPTAYEEKIGDEVKARFGKDEVVHGSMKRTLPSLFGKSKVQELLEIVDTLKNMDNYNSEVYGIGHIGKLISLGLDENEITQMKMRIENEIRGLSTKDIQTKGRGKSKKTRLVFLSQKRGTERPVALDIMPSLGDMQSIEFYSLYISAACSLYKVQPIFMTITAEGRTGQTPVVGIRVQDRTSRSYQEYLERIFNEKVWVKFGVTDWGINFNKIEDRDELRDAQVLQTEMAAALTAVRAGLDVSYKDGKMEISGEGEYMEGMRFMGGKPRQQEQGAATGVASVRPDAETRESSVTGELIQRGDMVTEPVVRLPISWEEVTRFEAFNQVYMIGNDMDEVFLSINGKEVPETRIDARNLHYALAILIGRILNDAQPYVTVDFSGLREAWIMNIRREYNSETLKEISNFFERTGLAELAKKFDNLRDRLDKLLPSTLEEQHV